MAVYWRGVLGRVGGKQLAKEFGAPFLGEIPVDVAIREATDSGTPYQGAQAGVYTNIAKRLTD